MNNNCTPRDNRAFANKKRRGHLQVPNASFGPADLIRSRSPSPAAAAPGAFQFFPQQRQQPEEEQFHNALSSTSNSNMPDLSVDNIVKIARALAKAAAQGMAATICLPAADAKLQQEKSPHPLGEPTSLSLKIDFSSLRQNFT